MLRIRKLFSYPQSSVKANRATRKDVRRIYWRPISCFARVANVEWVISTVRGKDPSYSHGVGYWEIDYINKYLFPTLGLGSDKMFTLLNMQGIKSADCLIDLGAIYPFRFYLADGRMVDFIEERAVINQLTPTKWLGYKERTSMASGLCISLLLALSMTYLFLTLYMVDNGYPSYYHWVLLLVLDTLVIVRPWLFLMPKKPLYLFKDFTEKTHLTSSNFESNNIYNLDRLFYKDMRGLVSQESYIEFDSVWPFIAFYAVAGMTLPTLVSIALIITTPILFFIQVTLYIVAWILMIKGVSS